MPLDERLLNEVETAEFLNISRSTLRRQRSKNAQEVGIPTVPWFKLGRSVKYSLIDLLRYIELRRQETKHPY